jgi:ribosome-associated protein
LPQWRQAALFSESSGGKPSFCRGRDVGGHTDTAAQCPDQYFHRFSLHSLRQKGKFLIILAYLDRVEFCKKPGRLETDTMIEITNDISISEDELVFKVSRSGGPGGQNVNKVNTRVTLFFDVANCGSLSDWQKKRILSRLATRADKNGVLRVVSQKFRTQRANRNAAVKRLQELLAGALKTRPIRKKSKVSYAAKQRRLEEKRRRSLLKRQRSAKNLTGDFAD